MQEIKNGIDRTHLMKFCATSIRVTLALSIGKRKESVNFSIARLVSLRPIV